MFTQSDTKNTLTALFVQSQATELSVISTRIKNACFYNKFSSKSVLPYQPILSSELTKMQVDTKKYMESTEAVQNNNYLLQFKMKGATTQNSLCSL